MRGRTGKFTNALGKWCRSGEFDCCKSCGTSERPHKAFGLCRRCYEKFEYRRNREKRKLRRLQWSDEKAAAKYQQEKRWKGMHREQALLKQREHYLRNQSTLRKWPVGSKAFYELVPGTWIEVKIVEALGYCKVRTKTGAVIATSFKKVKKSPPYLYGERDVA